MEASGHGFAIIEQFPWPGGKWKKSGSFFGRNPLFFVVSYPLIILGIIMWWWGQMEMGF